MPRIFPHIIRHAEGLATGFMRSRLLTPPYPTSSLNPSTPQTVTLVEQWSVSYTVSAGPSTEPSAGLASLRNLYKQFTIYFRALYTLLHALPAYQVGRV